jgi:esterase
MVTLHTRSYGEAGQPALVLLHGLFGSSANWGSIARQLANRYQVLVPDLRNHGQSPHVPEHDYPAMADDLRGLLRERSLDGAIFIGHSMGGKVAMQLALSDPQRVRGLAVVDMSPVAYAHDFAAVLSGFDAVDLAAVKDRADADRQLAAHVPASGVRAFLMQNLVRRDDRWQWRLNLAALRNAQAQITGFPEPAAGSRYPGPTAFIHGELSDYLRPSHHPTIERLFPNVRFCRVAEAGHWVYADRPQAFMACLDAFLERV